MKCELVLPILLSLSTLPPAFADNFSEARSGVAVLPPVRIDGPPDCTQQCKKRVWDCKACNQRRDAILKMTPEQIAEWNRQVELEQAYKRGQNDRDY